MVQKHRASSKATAAKDVSPMRNMSVNKYALSSSPATSMALEWGSRLRAPAANAGSSRSLAAENDKWKYNNMVNNDRSQFNNLHFC